MVASKRLGHGEVLVGIVVLLDLIEVGRIIVAGQFGYDRRYACGR